MLHVPLLEALAWLAHFCSSLLQHWSFWRRAWCSSASWRQQFRLNAVGIVLCAHPLTVPHAYSVLAVLVNWWWLWVAPQKFTTGCWVASAVPSGTSLPWSCCMLVDSAEGGAGWDLIWLEPQCFDEPFPWRWWAHGLCTKARGFSCFFWEWAELGQDRVLHGDSLMLLLSWGLLPKLLWWTN